MQEKLSVRYEWLITLFIHNITGFIILIMYKMYKLYNVFYYVHID